MILASALSYIRNIIKKSPKKTLRIRDLWEISRMKISPVPKARKKNVDLALFKEVFYWGAGKLRGMRF
jgi:hypothetical protein